MPNICRARDCVALSLSNHDSIFANNVLLSSFGDVGKHIINRILQDFVSDEYFLASPDVRKEISPLTPDMFRRYILAPELANLLVIDFGFADSVEEADKVRMESGDYGIGQFPLSDDLLDTTAEVLEAVLRPVSCPILVSDRSDILSLNSALESRSVQPSYRYSLYSFLICLQSKTRHQDDDSAFDVDNQV